MAETSKDRSPSWLGEYRRRRNRCLPLCQAEWKRALENQEFASGLRQWDGEDEKIAKMFKFACLTIPEISPIIDVASGRQILSRFERAYQPFSDEQADWAELLTEVDRAMMQSVDADQEESEAFRDGPCVQGLSAIRWLYSTRSGYKQILVENWPIWQTVWPVDEARRMNLTDRNWHIFGEWYELSEAKAEWPEHADQLPRHAGVGWPDAKDEMSSRVEWQGQPGTQEGGATSEARASMVFVEHYEWRSLEPVFRVFMPVGPQQPPVEIGAFDEEELGVFQQQFQRENGQPYPEEGIVESLQYVYRFAKVVGGNLVLEEGKLGFDAFTLEFLTGNRDPKRDKTLWLAMVDRLKDAQKWVNLYLSSMARIFQSNPKGTLLVERGVFRNRSEAVRQWTSPNSVVEMERGRMSGPNKPYDYLSGKDSPAFRMAEALMGYTREAMPRLVGFNPGALGQLGPDLRRISGEVLRGVQDAAVAGNANAYDAYSLYRRRAGRLFLKLLKAYFEPEDIIRIVGEKAFRQDPATGQQYSIIPPKEMWDPTAWKAIAISEQGPTPDQRRAQWQGLVESGGLQILLTPGPTGYAILEAEDVIEMMPALPESRRDKILARHRQRQQALVAMQQAAAGQQQAVAPQQPPPQAQGG